MLGVILSPPPYPPGGHFFSMKVSLTFNHLKIQKSVHVKYRKLFFTELNTFTYNFRIQKVVSLKGDTFR